MFPFVAHITYFDSYDEKNHVEHVLIYGTDFSNAMETIERYYGNDMVRADLTCVGDECTLFTVDESTANYLELGEGNLINGLDQRNLC